MQNHFRMRKRENPEYLVCERLFDGGLALIDVVAQPAVANRSRLHEVNRALE